MPTTPRYCPDRRLPAYSYVPGLAPHPISDTKGHSFGAHHAVSVPLEDSSYTANADYLYAIDLFNHGYYWEAHEEWERFWHAAGRSGSTADFLKGLIKLAAAGVKLREGRAGGVAQHARRAAELIDNGAGQGGKQKMFGLCSEDIRNFAQNLAKESETLVENHQPDAARSLDFVLRLEGK